MSQPRVEDATSIEVWAIWDPVDPHADPLVIGGDYGNVKFRLASAVSATTVHTNEWTFEGSATAGKWVRRTTRIAMSSVIARMIMPLELDAGSRRISKDQLEEIFWRAALLQLPVNRFAVVAHRGGIRLARVKRCEPLTVDLEAGGGLAALHGVMLDSWDSILLPGKDTHGKATAGVAQLADIAQADRDRMGVWATESWGAQQAPAYVIRLPKATVAPGVVVPATQPLGTSQGGTYAQLTPDSGVGSQWSISVTVGSTMMLDRVTVEMKRPGFVTVLSGPKAGNELEWPAPAITSVGIPISITVHSGPTNASGRQQGGSAYEKLSDDNGLSETDILTWGPFLDVESVEAGAVAQLQFTWFLERSFAISPSDGSTKMAMARDELLRWAKRAREVDWRAESDVLNEGKGILRRLRLVALEAQGYDISSLLKGADTKDDIFKEKARQDAVRRVGRTSRGGQRGFTSARGIGGSLTCFNCHQKGHIARNCTVKTPANTPTPPNTTTGNPQGLKFAQRECQYCFEHGLSYKGHFSDNCWKKNPEKKMDFPSGGAPLRK